MHTKLTACVDLDTELALLSGKVVNVRECLHEEVGRYSCCQRMGNNDERWKSSLLFKFHQPAGVYAFTFKIIKCKMTFTFYDGFRFRAKYGYYNVKLNLNQWLL